MKISRAKTCVSRKWTTRIACFSSAALPIILTHHSLAAASTRAVGDSRNGLTFPAILSIIVGVIISIIYIRGMYLILHYASETYAIDIDFDPEVRQDSSTANKILLFGSAMLVVLSALIILSYGWGWLFLYIGPVLCLLGPLVIIVSMQVDLKQYKRALRTNRQLKPTRYEPAEDVGAQSRR